MVWEGWCKQTQRLPGYSVWLRSHIPGRVLGNVLGRQAGARSCRAFVEFSQVFAFILSEIGIHGWIQGRGET